MQKNLLIKTLAVGIIFLFIGVAVAPSTAVNIPNKEDVTHVNDTSEDDCDCQPVDEISLVRIERAVDRLERYTRIVSLLSKHYPEFNEEYEELSNEISTLETINDKLNPDLSIRSYDDICIILWAIWYMIFIPASFFYELGFEEFAYFILSVFEKLWLPLAEYYDCVPGLLE